MDSSMYSALFGALANEHRMNNIANNLANVNTTGFKRDMLSFQDTFAMYSHDRIMEPVAHLKQEKLFPDPVHVARPRIAIANTDFAQGSTKITGSPFDVAIAGDGFFKIRTIQGDFYTRNGHFTLTADGTLITEQGFPVLGAGGDGEVVVPAGVEKFTISAAGEIYADGDLVGQIGLFSVDEPGKLEKLGANLYRQRAGSDMEEIPSEATMIQGFLEVSNVNPVYEMVNMIEAQRQFEAYAKIMQTSQAIDQQTVSRVGRGRQ